MNLSIRKEAEQEITRAYAWYQERSISLGARFAAELEHYFNQIRRHPLLYPAAYYEIRRAPLRTFPYSIYYLATGRRVVVLRVLHQRQQQPSW